jgi:hypothetical protein
VVIFNTVNKDPESPRQRDPSVPKDLETICLKAMSKLPSGRYADCREFSEDLRRWLDEEPIRARRLGALERIGKWARRSPVMAGLTVIAGVLALVSGISTVGLLISRQELAEALQNETHQRDLAETQAQIAQRQSRFAEEEANSAKQSEREAERSLAELEAENAAFLRLESEREAESRRRRAIEEKDKKSELELKKKEDAIAEAKKSAESAEEERRKAQESSAWNQYTRRLLAADKALAAKDNLTAKNELELCPKENRGFEWKCLDSIARCKPPAVTMMRIQESFTAFASRSDRELEWCGAGVPDDPNKIAVYRLPAHQLNGIVKIPASESRRCYVSPKGEIVCGLSQGASFRTVVCSVGTKENKSWNAVLPIGRSPFSKDGQWCLVQRGTNKGWVPTVTRRTRWAEIGLISAGGWIGLAEPSLHGNGDGWDFHGDKLFFEKRDCMPGVGTQVQIVTYDGAGTIGSMKTTTFLLAGGQVSAGTIIVSPDVHWAIYGNLLLDMTAKRLLRQLPATDSPVCFSPDGQRLLVKTAEGYPKLVCTTTGHEVPVLTSVCWLNGRSVDSIAANPKWTRVLTTTEVDDGTEYVCWSVAP